MIQFNFYDKQSTLDTRGIDFHKKRYRAEIKIDGRVEYASCGNNQNALLKDALQELKEQTYHRTGVDIF